MEKRNKPKSKKTNKASSSHEGAIMTLSHPPQINPQITHNQRFRFVVQTTAASQKNITFNNLLDCLFVATSATTGVQVFDSVKIKKVELWYVPTSTNPPSQVVIAWNGAPTAGGVGIAGNAKVVGDTSLGIEPAHVLSPAPRDSNAGLWNQSSTAVAFSLTCPVGTVVDVEMSLKTDESPPTSVTNAPVGAVAGQFYFRGLDGNPIASTTFLPQALGTL